MKAAWYECCDKLDVQSRRQLFPTTREALRDTATGDDLRRLVTDTRSADPQLHRLDRERKELRPRYREHVGRTLGRLVISQTCCLSEYTQHARLLISVRKSMRISSDVVDLARI